MRVSLSKQKLHPGDTLIVSVSLEIDDGWHLYAANPEAKFLIPTKVSVEGDVGIAVGEIVDPKSETRMDPILKTKLNTYVGNIEFKIPVTIGDKAKVGATKLKVVIDSQACDESRCLKPEKTTFELSVEVVDSL